MSKEAMDFASAPFQALLVENAGSGQLVSFLQQLDQQYREATDEKVRFGTLQILLPIFKAHIMRLDDADKERECIHQYLQPWMQSSFAQDSMVSTESVELLEKTVSFLMGRSMLLYARENEYCFGQSTLSAFLYQLVHAMKVEPDFVDLKPLDFIQNNMGAAYLEEMDLQQQQQQPQQPLDLECCLDTLNLFVRDLNENEDMLKIGKSNAIVEKWMDLTFSIAVGMIPCTDVNIRNKLTHDLLPNLLRWQQSSTQSVDFSKQVQWCELLWKRTLEIFALPATNLLRLEIYGLIARFFDYYFGQSDISNNTDPRKDLRFNEDFFKILQSGLRSSDSLARKYSSYILKRIIDFTDKHPSDTEKWTPYFKWDSAKSQTYLEYWDDWFLLYDIMHENVIHLVDPVLPRLESLLNADLFDASWWILLLYRGFQNDTASVRKGLLEYIFARQDPKTLNKLGVQQSFMFGALFKTVDNAPLFQVPTQGTMVSPFGEHFRFFMLHLINSMEDKQEKTQFLKQLIHHISHVVNSFVPILYTMEALAEVQEVDAWGPEELKSLRYLVDRHRNFTLPATKQFLRKLGIAAVVRLANTSVLSFSDVAKTISSLVNEFPVKTTSMESKLIRQWLQQKVSKDETLESVQNELKGRIKTYVYDLNSQDIPEAVLRTQANVLARTSVFVVACKDGSLNGQFVSDLLQDFSTNLKDNACEDARFSRLLTLLDALWENFDKSFDQEIDFLQAIGLTNDDTVAVLNRVDHRYLKKDNETIFDIDVLELYLSITRRILLYKSTLTEEKRLDSIIEHYELCLDLLKYRPSALSPSHEIAKSGYLTVLSIVYEAARVYSLDKLEFDDALVSLVYGLQMKRTQEALRERTWGDCLSTFIRCKWECVEMIIRYATVYKDMEGKTMFDPSSLYEEAVEQLESGSELCGEAIIRSFGPLLALPWDKESEAIEQCVDYAIALMKENWAQSKTFPLLIKAFIDVIFQPALLSIPELNEDGGPIKKAFDMVLETGELRPFIIAQTSHLLHQYWSAMTEETNRSMIQYVCQISKLLVFGPLRDRDDQKLEAAFTTKLATPADILEAEGSAETMFNQNDYLVRVDMNDLLLRLDMNNKQHMIFANLLIDRFFHIFSDDILYEFMYTSTIEHRLKLRTCCSMMLVIDFSDEDKVEEYLELLFGLMRKETVSSVRCYLEWAVVRLLRKFPKLLPILYDKIADPNHKPNFVISLLTVTFTLCDVLPEDTIQSYFEEIFVRLIPWLITNHFTIRLFSYCAWQRNYKSCIERGFGQKMEENKYLKSIGAFMETYVDCIKFFDKIQAQFYMSKFDPVQDFNVEFIFRQMMTEFRVIDNEKIGSKSFVRLNPTPVARCPFQNPARQSVYTSADAFEMIGHDLEEDTTNTNTVLANSNTNGEDVYQKKIMPWEMMLETDMDLTKNLVDKKRRRNDIIVVASLIDRLPNLAGLCRTCEIFNASQLVVPTLKIKDDIGFTTVSVASEKWMPMIEVAEQDLVTFLQSKKEEGYTLCGLEQTTTSATLGEYEFPEKCVLLLGKERQGVPAALLQMLDVTIEIPQYGITRSLNVHVSGAICIYEYTKQMHWRQQKLLQQQ